MARRHLSMDLGFKTGAQIIKHLEIAEHWRFLMFVYNVFKILHQSFVNLASTRFRKTYTIFPIQ